MSPVRMLGLAALVASTAFASSGVFPGGALSVTQLKPDGSYSVLPDCPLRFQFAPVDGSASAGTRMTRFRHWVRAADGALVIDRLVVSEDPLLELPASSLEPGRYQWGVQWWSTDNETAEAASEVLVAPRADAWDGVPWLGAADVNEFQLEVDAPVGADAELLIAALGFGYVTLNDQEISKDVLSYSGWTAVDKRVLFRSYRVTHLLEGGGKAKIFVALGCGYRCDAKGQKRLPNHPVPAEDNVPKVFRLQLHVGGKLVAHSGSSGWQARRGPVLDDSVYDGEHFNRTAATAWGPATPLPQGHGPQGVMVAASFPGVQITRVDTPIAISKPAAGVFVVDFGSNVAGVCNISIPSAASVTLRHGEVLQHAGMTGAPHPEPGRVYFYNLRSAKATDTVTTDSPLKGWWPRFTYHGFRYVEVTGFPGELTAGDISRLRMHTNVDLKSHAYFGDETLQAIHEGSRGSQLSNLMQVPTDSPQRDERLGWMGDASVSTESMMLHFDYGAMAAAFSDSMIDAMGDDGNLPDIAPLARYSVLSVRRPGDSSWTAAFIEILTQLWKVDGDLEPTKARWSAVQRHMAFIEVQYQKVGSLDKWPEHYGDWCPPSVDPWDAPEPNNTNGEVASPGFSAAFSAARTVRQAADLAAALKMEEASNYSALATKMKEDFHKSFYKSVSKTYDKGYMVNYVLPLALGAVPPEEEDAVFQGLLGHIASKNGTWSGGILNNRFLFDLLHDRGHSELALAMLKRRDYPSYGCMHFNDLEPAKECMWEVPNAPFTMNSRNHHMFSSVGSYLTRRLAGLHQGESARELRAFVGPKGLSSASMRLQTPRGQASWTWNWSGESLSAEIDVPVGMHAQVHLPAELDVRALGSKQQVLEPTTVGSSSLNRVTLPSGRHSIVAEPSADDELFA